MSVLVSLAKAYDRLPDAPALNYSSERIGYVIALNPDGTVATVAARGEGEGRKRVIPPMLAPQPVKKSVNISPNFLWGNSAHVLGVTARADKKPKRLSDEHEAFKTYHLDALAGSDDAGLAALRRFIETWTPSQFAPSTWPEEIKDQNIAFALESERLRNICLHDRPAAKDLWAQLNTSEGAIQSVCLVTGARAPIARLHPSIKGVWGAQSSGASIVSFNQESFCSYGHEQGENAPVSEAIAFKYTTALNAFLNKDSRNRIQIGDASTVFWADASNASVATEAESIFGRLVGRIDEIAEADRVGDRLKLIVRGVPLERVAPELSKGVRFFVLGLSPNAARLSIRYWFEDDFGVLTKNYQEYVADLRFEPTPSSRSVPTIRSLVLRTAPARREPNDQIKFDADKISPLLAGELFRAILTNGQFPGALLSVLLMRIRADHLLDSIRISLIKAAIVRVMRLEGRLPQGEDGSPRRDYLMRSDPDDSNEARRLGRLFALIERAQLAALGDKINTTVKDNYLGTAAATPQQAFPALMMNAEKHHLKRLRNGHSDANWIKDAEHARKIAFALGRDMGRLWATFSNELPRQHSNEEQGLFLVGYYQERFGKKSNQDDGGAPEDEAPENNDEE